MNNNNHEDSESNESRRVYEGSELSNFREDNFEEAWVEEAISRLVYEIIREFLESGSP